MVLMAGGRLAEVCDRLIAAGRPADQPAAVVQWAATSAQRSVVAPLGELAGRAAARSLGPPATLVVGEVAALAEELSWFRSEAAERSADRPALSADA